MSEEKPKISWEKCAACKAGRVMLFNSAKVCDVCRGTGLNLSDPRLAAPIVTPNTPVRVAKGLRRQGIDTLRELVCQAAAGKINAAPFFGASCLQEVRAYLIELGLPSGPEFQWESVAGLDKWQ